MSSKPTYEELEYDHAILYEQYKRQTKEIERLEALYMNSQEVIHAARTVLNDREEK